MPSKFSSPGIRKAARAYVKMSLRRSRQPDHRLSVQWQKDVDAFESRMRAVHPRVTPKRFTSTMLREADMEIHVLELQDLFRELRPRLEGRERRAHRAAMEEFRSRALKWMTPKQYAIALQRLREMGFIPLHGKPKQFHSGHFVSEEDALHAINAYRARFHSFLDMWRVPRAVRVEAWESMVPFMVRRFMEFDPKKSSLDTFSFATMRDAIRHYLHTYKKQNRPAPQEEIIPAEKPELRVHFSIRRLVERVGRENVERFAQAALNPIELRLMQAELQGEPYQFLHVNNKWGRPLSLRGKRWHWSNAVKKIHAHFRRLVRVKKRAGRIPHRRA